MIQCKHGEEKEISIMLNGRANNFKKYFCNEKSCNVNPEYCKDCEFIEPKNIKHYMIGCSEECLRFACCDFCLYASHDFFFTEDKDGNIRIVTGGPNGCNLHRDKEHQEIAKGCGYCSDFHCSMATEQNQIIKEIDDET